MKEQVRVENIQGITRMVLSEICLPEEVILRALIGSIVSQCVGGEVCTRQDGDLTLLVGTVAVQQPRTDETEEEARLAYHQHQVYISLVRGLLGENDGYCHSVRDGIEIYRLKLGPHLRDILDPPEF